MLNIKPFREKPSFCGPASLKMVLSYFGVEKSEDELAKLSGASVESGVEAKGLIKAAKKLGFKGKYQNYSTFNDIKKYVIHKKIPVIVDWFSVDDGHYSAVMDIDNDNIYLMDPQLGFMRAMKLETFKRVWFDFPGKFIKHRKQLTIRRIIVIYPSSQQNNTGAYKHKT